MLVLLWVSEDLSAAEVTLWIYIDTDAVCNMSYLEKQPPKAEKVELVRITPTCGKIVSKTKSCCHPAAYIHTHSMRFGCQL